MDSKECITAKDNITVLEFCLKHTKAKELVIVKDRGYIIASVWIDHEDLFVGCMHPVLRDKLVIKEEWDEIPIILKHGDSLKIPCHCIHIKL